MAIGVFPADLKLDSNVHSADGKRCALLMMGLDRDAHVLCDGGHRYLSTIHAPPPPAEAETEPPADAAAGERHRSA